jgi:hypothetical protein
LALNVNSRPVLAAGHRVHSVQHQVQQHLLQMHTVAAHGRQLGILQSHVTCRARASDRASATVSVSSSPRSKIFNSRHAAFQQRPHPFNHAAGALVVLADVRENGADFFQVRFFFLEKNFRRLRIPQNGAERLVQFVRERGRQLSHR